MQNPFDLFVIASFFIRQVKTTQHGATLVVGEFLFVVTFVSSSSLLLGLHLYRQLNLLTNIPNTVVLKVHLFNFYLAHFQQANQTYKFFLSVDTYYLPPLHPSIPLTLSGFWH